MRGTATLPDGSQQDLLWIRQWDIRWQDRYRYQSPLFLPRGTRLSMRFTYDNSAANPQQPLPVRRSACEWGPRSTDEMARSGSRSCRAAPRTRRSSNADYHAPRGARRHRVGRAERRVEPGDAAAHNLLATEYLQVGRVADAQAQLEEALRLDPRDAEAHSNLGAVLQAQGRLADGMPQLRTAVQLKPKDDRVHFNLGNGLLAAGQPDAAMREFRAAIALNPENADAHFNLAMILGPRRQLDEAITHLRRVVEIDPRTATPTGTWRWRSDCRASRRARRP